MRLKAVFALLLVSVAVQASILKVPQLFETLEDALVAANAGDTIMLSRGTYLIEADLNISKPLTIASYFMHSNDPEDISATRIKAGKSARKEWFDIQKSAVGSKIIGLTILGNETHSMAIRNTHTTVTHCRFIGGKDQLSFEHGGGHVSDCYFEGAGDDAIDADESLDWIIEHNTIVNCSDDGTEVRLHDKEAPMTHHIYRYNTIEDTTTGIQLIDYPGDSHRTFKIYGNVIKRTSSTAIDCTVHTSNRNTDGSPMVEEVFVFNNTIDNCQNGITLAPNVTLANMIFSNLSGTAVIGGRFLSESQSIDHILFFNNAFNASKSVVLGKNSLRNNPLFETSGSYRLSSQSPAIDAGTATIESGKHTVITLPVSSFYGSAPDLGAFEFH